MPTSRRLITSCSTCANFRQAKLISRGSVGQKQKNSKLHNSADREPIYSGVWCAHTCTPSTAGCYGIQVPQQQSQTRFVDVDGIGYRSKTLYRRHLIFSLFVCCSVYVWTLCHRVGIEGPRCFANKRQEETDSRKNIEQEKTSPSAASESTALISDVTKSFVDK